MSGLDKIVHIDFSKEFSDKDGDSKIKGKVKLQVRKLSNKRYQRREFIRSICSIEGITETKSEELLKEMGFEDDFNTGSQEVQNGR